LRQGAEVDTQFIACLTQGQIAILQCNFSAQSSLHATIDSSKML